MRKWLNIANKGVLLFATKSTRKTQPWIWKAKFGEQTGNDLE